MLITRILCTLAAAAVILSLAPSTSGAGRRAAPGGGEEKTVEQVKKNIQVLRGLPESQLDQVMDYFAASLGVNCAHCHVVDTSGWFMERDDKQTKKTARKMIQMVMDINAKSFGGRADVTCYTCHRGSTEPAEMIPLPRPQASREAVEEDEEAETASLPPAESVVSMAERAAGGADAMHAVTSLLMKGVSVDIQGRENPIEVVRQAPDRFAATVTMKNGSKMVRAFDGTRGWMSSPRGTREVPADEVAPLKREGVLFPAARLREMAAKVHVKDKDTVNGTTAYLLAAPLDEHSTEEFYVDSSTGLIVRTVVVTETMIGDIPRQVDYSDYRAVGGVKVPFFVRAAAVDPKDGSTRRFTAVEPNVAVDEKMFVMPPQGK